MYCKVCGKKLDGTEKFCSDCGNPIDYSDMQVNPEGVQEEASGRDNLGFIKSAFHMDGMKWDLDGYPIDEKKTDRVDFDWASVLEGKEKKAAEERRRAIAMTEEDIYERIQSDRHNDEFDWNLVHTMRLDRAGRSELSLFHEDDEELFSVDFIPPLNTAGNYDNMAKVEDISGASKGTVVIDRIDKSDIEEAADKAAGIQERDYEALGIKTEPEVQDRRKIEKFYTFNRKNEEFQALLDQEYERIRQKVQAETEKEEMVAAAESETGEGNNIATETAEPVPMTRGEVAKASAEAEADEAERLAEEAERLAEEAAAKARAAEEAAAKAAAEAQAAEEALKAMEEEEARATEEAARRAAEEEAARKAAEEETARKAAEEAARKAEEEAAAKEKEAEEAIAKAKAAEETAAAKAIAAEAAEEEAQAAVAETIVAPKSAFEIEAEKLALEEAAVDAELEKLNESHRALEAVAAEIEAGVYDENGSNESEIEASDEKKVTYGDIFDDEDDYNYKEKKGGCKTLFLDLIIVILLIMVVASCLLIFLPDHSISKRIKNFLPFFSEQTVDPIEDQGTENNVGETSEENSGESSEPEPTISDTAAAISRAAASVNNLGDVAEDQALLFVSGTDYGMEGVEQATVFENGLWYTTQSGANITYTDEVVRTVMEYYSELMNKLNEDDNSVMDLVAPNSQLYGELSAISANPEVTHAITNLRIGEIRSNSSDFYVLVRVTETISSEETPEITTKLMYMQADTETNTMKIMNIVDIQ